MECDGGPIYQDSNSWSQLRPCPLASRFYTNKLEGVVHVHTPQSIQSVSRVPAKLLQSSLWYLEALRSLTKYTLKCQYVHAEH